MTAAMAAERTRERVVLIVDDDPDILQTLALCLSTEGYGVLIASNGQEALDVLRQQKPACILLDLMMPVMDGWQFVTEMEQRGWRKAPLLILSADRAAGGGGGGAPPPACTPKPIWPSRSTWTNCSARSPPSPAGRTVTERPRRGWRSRNAPPELGPGVPPPPGAAGNPTPPVR